MIFIIAAWRFAFGGVGVEKGDLFVSRWREGARVPSGQGMLSWPCSSGAVCRHRLCCPALGASRGRACLPLQSGQRVPQGPYDRRARDPTRGTKTTLVGREAFVHQLTLWVSRRRALGKQRKRPPSWSSAGMQRKNRWTREARGGGGMVRPNGVAIHRCPGRALWRKERDGDGASLGGGSGDRRG